MANIARSAEHAESRWLDARIPSGAVFAGSVAAVLVIAIGDYLSGPYLMLAAFYMVPVVATAWFTGRDEALVVAAAATIVGVASTAVAPGEVATPVYLWNGFFRFLTYAFLAVLVSTEHTARDTILAMSGTDPLTGLSNRRRFYEQCERELVLASRSGDPLAVIYLDVDGLKARNDTAGHQAGDEMLAELARVARKTFRSSDLIARLGGDEFCILVPGADLTTAEGVLDRFEAELARARPEPIRISTGVVAGPIDQPIDMETVVHEADSLMYRAKADGKSRRISRPSLLAH